MQRISFLGHGVRFGQPDSTTHPGTCSVSAELAQDFIRQDSGLTETLSEALAATAAIVPLGCSIWDCLSTGSMAESRGGRGNSVLTGFRLHWPCHRTFSPWTDPSFLRAVVPLELVSRHAVLLTDASATGLGATYNKRAVSGGMDGSPTALAYQLPRVASSTPGRLRSNLCCREDSTALIEHIQGSSMDALAHRWP